MGGGIYGVSCENEIFSPKPKSSIEICFWSLLTMGGGIYGVENYDIQISLNHGGIYDGGIYSEYNSKYS